MARNAIGPIDHVGVRYGMGNWHLESESVLTPEVDCFEYEPAGKQPRDSGLFFSFIIISRRALRPLSRCRHVWLAVVSRR